jgi:hypothetical protein
LREFAAVCLLAYTVMSLFVGGRLIRRGLVARDVPELLMGMAYFLAPGIGYPMVVTGSEIPDHITSSAVFALGQALIVLGVMFFFFFNARVFRPDSFWAQALASLSSIVLALACWEVTRGHSALGKEFLGIASVRTAMMFMVGVLGIAYSWTAYEGYRHHRMMLRRARVGLGDAVVANRFLLWGIAGSLQVCANCVSAWSLVNGQNIAVSTPSVLATSIVGVLNSGLLVLIFVPPARYIRWLNRVPAGALASA